MQFKIQLLIIVFTTQVSFAFKTDRHAAIEKEAKERLNKLPASGTLPAGSDILKYLNDNIYNFSVGTSAHPDMDLWRQFASERQVYHFMANWYYAVEASKQATTDLKRRFLLKKALPDCLELVYLLFRETVDNNKGADQAGRGIFVLMHVVTDSYSREHTTRNSSGELITIKSWELSKIHWKDCAKDKDQSITDKADTYALLHTKKGEADAQDIDKDGKFTEEGEAAVNALIDLMIALYQSDKDKSNSETYIMDYMKTHFKPENSTISGSSFNYTEGDNVNLSYKSEYESKDGAVIKFDRYPRHSISSVYQTPLNDFGKHSIGLEYGFHVTPYKASLSGSFIRRIPFGLLITSTENLTTFRKMDLNKTLQFQITPDAIFYLPIANSTLRIKAGYGFTPFLSNAINNAFITGLDYQQYFGQSGWYISAGWEYDSSCLPSRNYLNLKLGFNTWQGRVIKK